MVFEAGLVRVATSLRHVRFFACPTGSTSTDVSGWPVLHCLGLNANFQWNSAPCLSTVRRGG